MGMNVNEFVFPRLQEWGLHRINGYPGDGVGGLDVAPRKAQGMHFVQVRHEEMAAFMACAHALAADRPVVLNCVTDPKVPPLPPTSAPRRRRTSSRWLRKSRSSVAFSATPCGNCWRSPCRPSRRAEAPFSPGR